MSGADTDASFWPEGSAEVYIKEEVEPADYLPEEYENEQMFEPNQEDDCSDPDFNASENSGAGSDSDGSSSNDTEYQSGKKAAARRPTPRSRRGRGHAEGRNGRTSSMPANTSVFTSCIKMETNVHNEADSSDGEIKESDTIVGMTRILHDAEIAFDEVERYRQCFVVLEVLPDPISSKGQGTVFSKEELTFWVRSYRPKTKVSSMARKARGLIRSRDSRYNPRICPKCGKTFTRPGGLKYHLLHTHIEDEAAAAIEMANRKYICETCGKRFNSKYALDDHNQKHTGIPLYPCRKPGCERKFRNTSRRSAHEEKCCGSSAVPGPGPVPNSTIDKSYYGVVVDGEKIYVKRPVNLKPAKPNPLLSALTSKQRRKVCRYCRRTFADYSYCRLHELRHQGIKPYRCTHEGCSSTFVSSTKLAEHVRIVHTGEKPFKCSYEGCGEEFARLVTFKLHIIGKHFEKNRHVCQKCGKAFATKQYLDKHDEIHTGYKPFLCSHCPRAFRSQYNLNLHFKVHTKPPRIYKSGKPPKQRPKRQYDEFGNVIVKERPYPCTQEGCSRAFMKKKNFTNHLRISHGIGTEMDTAQSELDNRHRPYPCTQEGCKRAFIRRVHFINHLRISHGIGNQMGTTKPPPPKEPRHRCTHCDKVFYTNDRFLVKHMKRIHGIDIHIGKERPYHCTQESCDQTFVKRSDLYRHLTRGHRLDIDINQLEKKYVEKRKPYRKRQTRVQSESESSTSTPTPLTTTTAAGSLIPSSYPDFTQQQQPQAPPPLQYQYEQHSQLLNSSYLMGIGNIVNIAAAGNLYPGRERGHTSGYGTSSSYLGSRSRRSGGGQF